MPVPVVQRLIYQKLKANIEVERPQVNRALNRFGAALRKIGLPYATGLTRKKATLFASLDPNMRINQDTVSEAKEALRKMDRTRADLALGEYWRMEHGLPKASRKRISLDRNILMAIAVSLGLHAGVTEIVCAALGEGIQATSDSEKPVEANTKIAKKWAPTVIMEAAELKLAELRQQKIEFIKMLLQDLKQGRSIPISAFAVKALVLDRNISRLENLLKNPFTEINEGKEMDSFITEYNEYLNMMSQGHYDRAISFRQILLRKAKENLELLDLIDEQEMRSRYENIENEAREWGKNLRTTEEKIDGLHYFDNFKILKGYLAGTDFLDVLIKGIHNCAGATWLHASLEDDLIHSPDYGVVFFSDHIRSWFRDAAGTLWEIENTNGGPPRRTPFTIGVRAPVEGIIADYLIRNGIPVDQLPEELAKIFSQEVPDSGLSVPEGLVPNPYFGVRDPSSIAGTTQELYEKMAETAEIIGEARVYASIYSLLQIYGGQGGAGSIDFSLIDLSRISKEMVCQIAKETLISAHPALYRDFDSQTRYSGAILLADLLPNARNDVFPSCAREDEWYRFEEAAKRIINGGNDYNDREDLDRGVVFPGRAREWLKKLYAVQDKNISDKVLYLLAWIASPADFDFFNDLLFNSEPLSYQRTHAINYFSRMQGQEAIRAKDILLRAYQTERGPGLRINIMESVAKLGYGMEVLTYMEEKLPSDTREYFNQHLVEDPSGEGFMNFVVSLKVDLISNITTLFPDRDPTPAELQYFIEMIHQEEDNFIRENLIIILALNGKIKEAQEELYKHLPRAGYGNSRENIHTSAFFYSHFGLLRHADFLIKQGFFPGPIIEALRMSLNSSGNDWGERIFAAVKLILAGEL